MPISFSCNVQGGANKFTLIALGKHNHRKFDESSKTLSFIDRSLTHENIILVGTDNVVEDLKKVYDKEFGSAVTEYNMKQKRSDRKILDYFEKISNDKKTNLYSSVVIQFNDKDYWQGKTIEEKKEAVQMLQEQFKIFKASHPEFKIANAVVHLDETSPHIQIIGVGVKEFKTGLSKRVSQKGTFGDKKSLRLFQETYQQKCLEVYNKMYHTNETLKEKTGRRFRYTQKEYMEYKENLNKALEKLEGQTLGNRVVLKKEQVEEVKEILQTHTEILGTVAENKKLRKKLIQQEKELQKKTEKKQEQIDELDVFFQQVEESKRQAQMQLDAIEEQLEIDRELQKELQEKNKKLMQENNLLEQKKASLEKTINEQNKKIEVNNIKIHNYEVENKFIFTNENMKQVIKNLKDAYTENEKKLLMQEQKIELENSKIEKQLEEKYTKVYNRVMKKELTILKKNDVEQLLSDVRSYKEFLDIISKVTNVQELFQRGKAVTIQQNKVNSAWSSRTKTDKDKGISR